MAEWKTVAQLDELPVKGGHSVKVDDNEIVLFRVGDKIHALENACPHLGFPLSDGWIEDETVTCPWHGWRFDVTNGECILGGGNAQRFEVRVEGGAVQIQIED